MQNLSGSNSKCWEEAGWDWVMQQFWVVFFFFLKLCKTDAETAHLGNLSCNHRRKNSCPGASSCLFFLEQLPWGLVWQKRWCHFHGGNRYPATNNYPSVTDGQSHVLLFSLLPKWVGNSMFLSGISEVLWHVMMKRITASWLPAELHRTLTNPNSWSSHTGFPNTVLFLKYSLLVTFWMPCNC